jgi:hypothetical protein
MHVAVLNLLETVPYAVGSKQKESVLSDPGETHESYLSYSGPKHEKKGTRRKSGFPLVIAMVPKAGFEPARVSPPLHRISLDR